MNCLSPGYGGAAAALRDDASRGKRHVNLGANRPNATIVASTVGTTRFLKPVPQSAPSLAPVARMTVLPLEGGSAKRFASCVQ